MKFSALKANDAHKLSEMIKSGDWMVLFYSEGCVHCDMMKPEWNKVYQKFPKNMNIAQVERDCIPELKFNPEIMGYPTIKMYNDSKEVAEFNEDRTYNKMMEFAEKHRNTIDRHISKKISRKVSQKINNKLRKLKKKSKRSKRGSIKGKKHSKNKMKKMINFPS